MDARGTGGLLVGMAIVVLVGACAAGSGPGTLPPSSSPSSSPSAAVVTPTATSGTASPSPTAAAASYGPVTVVTGTATCPGMSWDWTTEPDGTQHVRDGHSPNGCTVTADDPRVSGHRTSIWNMDLWGDANAGTGALVGWGTPRLENAAGAWEGSATGVASFPGRGDIMVNWYKGTGGYAGLAYFELWTGSEPWRIQGQIFPGDPPDLTAMPPVAAPEPTHVASSTQTPSPTSTAVDYGPVTVVTGTGRCPTADLGKATVDAAGVTHYQGGTFICTVTTDEPRVSGTETAAWSLDLWGTADNGALVQSGPARLDTAGGAWEGTGTGVYSSDRGDIIAFWYTGTGRYAGLSYFELWTGSEPWTIQGQVFPGEPPTP